MFYYCLFFLLIPKTRFSCLNKRGNFEPKFFRNFSKCNVFFVALDVAKLSTLTLWPQAGFTFGDHELNSPKLCEWFTGCLWPVGLVHQVKIYMNYFFLFWNKMIYQICLNAHCENSNLKAVEFYVQYLYVHKLRRHVIW